MGVNRVFNERSNISVFWVLNCMTLLHIAASAFVVYLPARKAYYNYTYRSIQYTASQYYTSTLIPY